MSRKQRKVLHCSPRTRSTHMPLLSGSARQNLPELARKIKGTDLLIILGYCCHLDNGQQSTYALENPKHQVSTYYQGYDGTTTEYMDHFKALVGVVETYGGAYGLTGADQDPTD
jgi:hypothetical protein